MPDSDTAFFDRQEVRAPAEREAAIFHALPGLIRHALDNAPGVSRYLRLADPDGIGSRAELERLPCLSVAAILRDQAEHPPLGQMIATPIGRLARILTGSRGQIVPEGARPDYWRFARALFAAGVRRADLIWNALPHHLGTLAAMAETGARALSCTVVPAGPTFSPAQMQAIGRLRPGVFVGTSQTLAAMLKAADGRPSFRTAVLVGPSPDPALLIRASARHGIESFFVYASDEIGLIAYETQAHDGLLVDESLIVEVLGEDGRAVGVGMAGRIVVTVFNPDFPLVRLITGDQAELLGGESPCGRTNMRIRMPQPASPE